MKTINVNEEKNTAIPPGQITKDSSLKAESSSENDREAHTLLNLINAEFQSDPMSVQCFDLRIVERVRLCVERQRALVEGGQ